MPLHTKIIVAGSWILLLVGLIVYSIRCRGE
jgi:hypothetical protein